MKASKDTYQNNLSIEVCKFAIITDVVNDDTDISSIVSREAQELKYF